MLHKRSTSLRPPSLSPPRSHRYLDRSGQAATYAGGVDSGQRQQQQRHTDDQQQLSRLEKALQQAHGGPVWIESFVPHYASLSVHEDFSHLPWLPRVSPLRSREQRSKVAVPSFHRKLGCLPFALGETEQHSVMAIEKEPGKGLCTERWVFSLVNKTVASF